MGTEFEQYLRPKTLFRLENFDRYLKQFNDRNNKKDCLDGIFEEFVDD